MTTIRLMAREPRPRFHGNGFVQLPLSAQRRLHIWHPSLPPIEGHNATIHCHVWDMQSRVLVGCLTHRTYMLHEITEWRNIYAAYEAGEDGPDRLLHHCDIRVTGEYQMQPGSVYIFPAGEYHESESSEVTATIIEKRPSDDWRGRRPLVLCPSGQPPTDAFDPHHQPREDAMWQVIDLAIGQMSADARREIEQCLTD